MRNALNYFVLILMLGMVGQVLAAISPGTYDHQTGVAYFLENDSSHVGRVIRVDFINRETLALSNGDDYYRSLVLDGVGKIVAFTQIMEGKVLLHFVDAQSGAVAKTVPAKISSAIYSANDRSVFTYYDDVAGEILVIDLEADTIERVPARKYKLFLWDVAWNNACSCFYYQLEMNLRDADILSSRTSKVYKIFDGELVEVFGERPLSMSPDGKVFYETVSIPDEPSSFVINASNGNILSEYYSGYLIDSRTRKIWGDGVLRILGVQGLFDLKTGDDIDAFRKAWFRKDGEKRHMHGSEYSDVAADNSRYVLMRSKADANRYVVQDITTGKVVEEYKKFW
jgi:hypothetical protein